MTRLLKAPVVAALFFLLQLYLGIAFIRSAAPTYDEGVHLASGYTYWTTGRYRLNIMDHPPLAEMWAAVPLLVLRPDAFLTRPEWLAGQPYHYADVFLYHNRIPAEKMLNSCRIFSLLTWSLLLGWALFSWSRRLGGDWAAAWTLAAAGLCPVLVSNIALVTTDGASMVFFFLAFWLLSTRERTLGRFAAAGACAGLALASKFNMILLIPLIPAAFVLERFSSASPRTKFPFRGLALTALCAVAALAAVYRFGQFPLYWQGLTATLARLDQGRSAFLLGEHSISGFFFYFPVALAVKTPFPILIAAAATAWAWIRRKDREAVWILFPLAAYFTAALSSKVQIGVRHLLPMMPFMALAAGLGMSRFWNMGRWGKALASGMGMWLGLSVLNVSPHLLAYFNEAAGGPGGGYRVLVDSNLDWGQGLKELGRELSSMGNPPVYLSYFGIADPAAYGIRCLPTASSTHVDRMSPSEDMDPAASGRVLLAVSATNLQSTYFADKSIFDWLKVRRPIQVAGYSIFLYDLTQDADGRAKLADLVRRSGFPGKAESLLVK